MLVWAIGIDRRSTILLVRAIGIDTAVYYTVSITIPLINVSHPQLLSTKHMSLYVPIELENPRKLKRSLCESTPMWPWPLDSTADSSAATIKKLPIPGRKRGQMWAYLASTECPDNCSMLRIQSERNTGGTQDLVDAHGWLPEHSCSSWGHRSRGESCADVIWVLCVVCPSQQVK